MVMSRTIMLFPTKQEDDGDDRRGQEDEPEAHQRQHKSAVRRKISPHFLADASQAEAASVSVRFVVVVRHQRALRHARAAVLSVLVCCEKRAHNFSF